MVSPSNLSRLVRLNDVSNLQSPVSFLYCTSTILSSSQRALPRKYSYSTSTSAGSGLDALKHAAGLSSVTTGQGKAHERTSSNLKSQSQDRYGQSFRQYDHRHQDKDRFHRSGSSKSLNTRQRYNQRDHEVDTIRRFDSRREFEEPFRQRHSARQLDQRHETHQQDYPAKGFGRRDFANTDDSLLQLPDRNEHSTAYNDYGQQDHLPGNARHAYNNHEGREQHTRNNMRNQNDIELQNDYLESDRSTTSSLGAADYQQSQVEHRQHSRRASQEVYLPFEKSTKQGSKLRLKKNTSLTSAEAKTFQNLLSIAAWKAKPDTPDLQLKLKEALGVDLGPAPEEKLALEYASKLGLTDEPPQEQTPEERKSEGEINRITSLFNDATSDARLWEILQEELLVPAGELDLEGDSSSEHSKTVKQRIDTLAKTFPRVLVAFQNTLSKTFPTSLYGLALLPWLKKSGQAAFALGATTELYNHHLRFLWKQRLDMNGMLATLEEMHQRVFDFDETTLTILDDALNHAASMIKSTDARKTFWTTYAMAAKCRRLENWTARVHDDINAKAITKAGRASVEERFAAG